MSPLKLTTLAASLSLVLAACQGGAGGGDSGGNTPAPTPTPSPSQPTSGTVSGTVALGVPVANATVLMKARDASGNLINAQGVLTDANGNYTIQASSAFKPPYLLQATAIVAGQIRVMHSLSMDELSANRTNLTANITPLTDTLYAATIGSEPQPAFANPDFSAYNYATLLGAQLTLRNKLAPLLKLADIDSPDNIDLIRSTFSANHSGIDKVLDVISVTPSTDWKHLAIANKADPDRVVVFDTQSKTATGTFETATPLQPAVLPAELSTIQSFVIALNSLFSKGLPSTSQLNDIIDNNYLNDGTNAATLRGLLLDSANSSATFKLENLTDITRDQASGRYRIGVVIKVTDTAGNNTLQTTAISYFPASNLWKFVGNGRNTRIDLATFYAQRYDFNGNPLANRDRGAGLILRIENSHTLGMDRVIVKGPGIGANGLTLHTSAAANCGVFSIKTKTCQTWYEFEQPEQIPFEPNSQTPKYFNYTYQVEFYRNPSDITASVTYPVRLIAQPLVVANHREPVMQVPGTINSANGQTSTPTLPAFKTYAAGELPVYWSLRNPSVTDNQLTFSLGIQFLSCDISSVRHVQTVEFARYQDQQGNRQQIFTTDKAQIRPEQSQFVLFNDGVGVNGVVHRELQLATQDNHGRIFLTQYQDTSANSCGI
ncbi:carboxypeptidase-like regulatory domain-containing protein [Chitinivorax sp. B]|uniref:carboxypeptidase-like regulatory domain-containing protein n=1 Tax=Chitinivorax sp. B TaxID=2502235 RepID=UPI0010FA0A0A|nr:carboxypeptidase-like regulatory domain-containing protein [Chitinivorax sp. B]